MKDVAIGTVSPTPGSITVKRAGDSIRVICSKNGYRDATYLNKPGLNAATLGNVILGGLVGLAVDAASGANNKYEEVMTIRLEPASAGEPGPEPGSTRSGSATAVGERRHDRALHERRFGVPLSDRRHPDPDLRTQLA